ncbi:MAG: DUF4230 domain-containing protein [Lachnospiraceae bacterium]|nr:DUF4230 domain-containing protein [Lachnospiraceae bacterium]
MKKVGFIVTALVLMALLGGLVGAKIGGGKKSILQKVADSVEEKSTLDVKTIEEILQPAGDLITQRYYYTDMDTFESYKELLGAKIPLTTDKVVFTFKGAISAGIVLSKVEFAVDEEEKTVTVTLPDIFIVSNEIFEDEFKAYEIKNSIFTETKFTDYALLLGSMKSKKAEELMKNQKFRDEARKEAENVISAFLKNATVSKDYKIIFK